MHNQKQIHDVLMAMIDYYTGDPKRIQHFLKVHAFAKVIGEEEGLSNWDQEILEIAALVHDIGIKRCEELYDSTSGKLQEFEGPGLAGELLDELGIDPSIIDRVCFLVSKHHTYEDVVGEDWQILLEADFLVNAYEEPYSQEAIKEAARSIFKTESGKRLLEKLYIEKAL